MRLAVLEADIPVPSVLEVEGRYGDMFVRLLEEADQTSRLIMSKYDVVEMKYPNIEDIDGILISGSRHNAFDDDEWILKLVEFTKSCFDQKKKIVGICFGHQIAGRALGATVGRSDKGWEVGMTVVDLTEVGKKLFPGIEGDKLYIEEMHRDIVATIPEGAEIIGTTSICPNQGFFIADRVITLQGHPEFNLFIIGELLESRLQSGIFTKEFYDETSRKQLELTRAMHGA
ncbi:hypothetical protein CANCADRAFT_58052 [Tortispora caseinolytica NRRL Y-17796]|uniref:Glutamine amidotransferase domain-containing protein n=1 Tax=Tortispora caseinolytica NRRL Y-17796 TaxID=767744 RepID=A0A1E4TB77_9ASCO|nr:hypothetical protein CANCADRAFT_58052 [Tortispora caseinolytica NRRL Y-17796]